MFSLMKGLKFIFMLKSLPKVSKQIRSEDIREIMEKNFVSILPVWAPLQLAWVNNVYRTFHDYEKFMIIMHLLMNTFEVYLPLMARLMSTSSPRDACLVFANKF